jgi:DNA-binding IclR family transcriptional regulator
MVQAAVTAVERALDIFEAFKAVGRPMSLSELSQHIKTPKSSCHAIVGTLIARGYLYSLTRPRSLYPTRRLYDVASELLRHDPLLERTTPLLERLRDTSKETVILGKRQGDSVIYLQVFEGLHAIRYSAKPGEFKPLHSSAMGKAVLGSMKEAELRALLDSLKLSHVTAATLTSTEAVMEDVLEGRRRGYYVTRGENVPDVWAVSATVTVNGETLGVTLAGPRHRMEPNLEEAARLLMATCHLLGRSLQGEPAARGGRDGSHTGAGSLEPRS